MIDGRNIAYRTPAGRALFENLNFELKPGHLLLITGPNGSGKSTLLRILLGRLAPARGSVTCAVSPTRVAYIPQLQNMEFHLPVTLEDVIRISADKDTSTEQLESLGLLSEEQLKLTWNTASGGERQRTLLTCALLREPKLLYLDEPLNHLDRASQKGMIRTIVDFLTSRPDTAVVLVSHLGLAEMRDYPITVVPIDLTPKGEGAS